MRLLVHTEHEGGFLWTLARKVAPALQPERFCFKGNRKNHGIKKRSWTLPTKDGQCAKVNFVKVGGLYLAPHNKFQAGKGLFEADGSEVTGDGLLLGDNSSFKSVPLLNISF